MSFDIKVKKYIEERQLIEEGDRLLIACSGGVDSMGLIYFFMNFQQYFKIQLFVAHVDHMLRGETSAGDRKFVEQFCLQHNIPIFSTEIPIPHKLQEEGGNLQSLCRRERYTYFSEVMETHHIHKLVTGHHADDQLESILMALTKAGTISGMKGIHPKRDFLNGTIIRPFLTVTKDEIRGYLERNGGTFREDASNSKDDYKRNRFRHHIVPLLKNENPNISMNANQFAEILQQEDGFLHSLALQKFHNLIEKGNKEVYTFKIPTFLQEPVALQRRIILILLNYIYNHSNIAQSYTIISSFLDLCKSVDGSAKIYLPNGFIAIRNYESIVVKPSNHDILEGNPVQQVAMNEWMQLKNGMRVYIGEASNVEQTQEKVIAIYYFNSENIVAPISLRSRRDGDRISLAGMKDQKRLSRLFIDEKIPLDERNDWPILIDAEDKILSVLGIRVSHDFSRKKRDTDDTVLIVAKKE